MTKISRFYIVVSGSLMNVSFCNISLNFNKFSYFVSFYLKIPNDYSFIQVMDIYCKIHFIYCVPFEAPLAQFMGVIQNYVYEMECDTKLTATTKNKAMQIFSETVENIAERNLADEV